MEVIGLGEDDEYYVLRRPTGALRDDYVDCVL